MEESESDQWICPECMDKYEIEENRETDSEMGVCPLCLEYRQLVKTKSLKESGKQPEEKQEGIECLPLMH